MVVSILHRISGAAITIVGLAVLTWWLLALSGGAESYAPFASAVGHWAGKVVLIGLTWAFFQHLLSGIRHLVTDTGQGFELRVNRASALVTIVGALLLTAALWAWLLGVVK